MLKKGGKGAKKVGIELTLKNEHFQRKTIRTEITVI